MDDLFKIESQEPIEMNQEEFFEKTKAVLGKIMASYSLAWQKRVLEDDEFPEEIVCKNCKGCGKFIYNDEEKECYQDDESGECYHRFCNYEELGIDIELCTHNVLDLLCVDKISSKE
jgi:hypothetical protein